MHYAVYAEQVVDEVNKGIVKKSERWTYEQVVAALNSQVFVKVAEKNGKYLYRLRDQDHSQLKAFLEYVYPTWNPLM